jgi:pyruvate/2-oxoglutarate dehydrogenase complex dihydrolipoamide acyltransferase (E2) component
VVVTDTDQKSLPDIARFLRERAEKLRSGKDEQYEKTQKGGLFKVLPIWCLALLFKLYAFLLYRMKVPPRWLGADLQDPFGSVMVTNVGRFGVDVAYAPLIRWTHVPLIILVGTARDMPTVVEGELCVRKMLPVSATIDHRLLDGAHVGKLSKIMRSYVEDPEGFEKNLQS